MSPSLLVAPFTDTETAISLYDSCYANALPSFAMTSSRPTSPDVPCKRPNRATLESETGSTGHMFTLNASVHNLDSFVLLKIFSYLSVGEQLACLRTCRTWRQLLQHGGQKLQQLSVCFNGRHPILELNGVQRTSETLPAEVAYCTTAHPTSLFNQHRLFARLHTLVISCTYSPRVLPLDLSRLPLLQQLEIHGSSYDLLSDTPLASIRHLYVDDWRHQVTNLMPSLQTLTLNQLIADDEPITDRRQQRSMVPNIGLEQLKINHVQFDGNNQSDRVAMDALRSLATYAPATQQLNLAICFSPSYRPQRHYRTLWPILKKWSHLQRLHLLFDLELNATRYVCEYVRYLLQELRMHGSQVRVQLQLQFSASLQPPITSSANADLGKLLHFDRCPNLDSVCVNGHRLELPTSKLELLGFIGVQTLYLTTNDLSLFDCASTTTAEYFSNVRTLCIERDCPPTDSMMHLLCRLPKLRELYFDCCIEPKLLVKLPSLCPNLEYLALEHWPRAMDLRLLAALTCLRSVFLRTDSSTQVQIDRTHLLQLPIPTSVSSSFGWIPSFNETSESATKGCSNDNIKNHVFVSQDDSNWNLCQLIAACPQLCNVNVDSELLASCAESFLTNLKLNAVHQPHLFHHLHLSFATSTTVQTRISLQKTLQQAIPNAPDNLYVSFYG